MQDFSEVGVGWAPKQRDGAKISFGQFSQEVYENVKIEWNESVGPGPRFPRRRPVADPGFPRSESG